MIKIKPYKNKTLNCYDNNIIATMTEYWERSSEFYYLKDLGFKFWNYDPKSLESLYFFENISTSLCNNESITNDFLGIEINYISNNHNEITNLISYIKNELENNRPVGVYMDSFFCPWNKYYKYLHIKHYFLIVDINIKDKVFNCVDGYLSNSIVNITFDELFYNYEAILIFSKNNNYVNNINLFKQFFAKQFIQECPKESNGNLEKFSNIVEASQYSYEVIQKCKYINEAKLITKITNVSNSRLNVASSLKAIENNLIVSHISYDIEEVHKHWEMVKNVLIKGFFKKRDDTFRIVGDILFKIANDEKEIVEKLKNI